MKNLLTAAAAGFVSLTLLSSCIQEEAPNAECDITGVESQWLGSNQHILIGAPIVTNDHVSFNIKKGTDRSAMAPRFDPQFFLASGLHYPFRRPQLAEGLYRVVQLSHPDSPLRF